MSSPSAGKLLKEFELGAYEFSKTRLSLRLKEISRFGRRWCSKKSPYRQKAIRVLKKESGFPPAMSERILDLIFKKLTVGNLKFLQCAQKRHPILGGAKLLGYVLPGNVPDPVVASVVGAWLNGSGCLLKLSRHQRGFGMLLAESIQKSSAAFAPALAVTADKKTFLKNTPGLNAVIAYGNDETMKRIRTSLHPNMAFMAHGHRMSAGVLFKPSLRGAALRKAAQKCAWDVWLYDQRGCLSPQIYFVEGDPDGFASKLEEELLRFYRRFGAVRRPYEVQIARRVVLDRLLSEHISPHRVSFVSPPLSDRPVVYGIKKAKFGYPASGQVVGVKAFKNLREVRRELTFVWKHLQSVSVGGTAQDLRRVAQAFSTSSVHRVCRIGQIQDPPLGWELQ